MNTIGRHFAVLLVLVSLLSSLGAAPARAAHPEAPPSSQARPLGDLLLPDGTLDLSAGFTGSLDPAGYQLVSGPGEPPRFAPEAAGDERWAAGFNLPGMNNTVYALAVSGSILYAGGSFSAAGGSTAGYIARWDGTSWSALGSGMNGDVRAFAVDGSGNLYAAGVFGTAGGVTVNHVAKWDGSAWSALGTGMNNSAYALALDGSGNLYAGGAFTTAGGSAANYVAKWDGSAWSALGGGMSSNVYALAVSGSTLYAGGSFTTAGGVTVNRVAKWDGSAWSGLGSGMNGDVRALAVSGGSLYAGGYFTTAGGVTVNRVARWDGSAWSALGSGLNSTAYALAVSGSGVYAGGGFTTAGGVTVNRVARWDGSAWSALGSGMDSVVYALAVSGSALYAGGDFITAGGNAASRAARWDGGTWSAMGAGSGMSATVYALAVDGSGTLYAGGEFLTAGGVAANHVARWNGTSWSALDSGTDNDVYALAVSGGTLYAGGIFTKAGGVTVNRVARWDGSAWSALGTGTNSTVQALAVSGSSLYAGGGFTTAGGVTVNRVAKWDGSAWSALGTGISGPVHSLAADGSGNLYAGGYFNTAGGITASSVAKWNGSAWSALGDGMNNYVYALALDGSGNLYAGGQFTTAGGSPAKYVAKWDGSAWSALGSGTNGYVRALALDGSGTLYAGGEFTTAGGNAADFVARWGSGVWGALGSGTSTVSRALTLAGGSLYDGGSFTSAGNKVSHYVGRWLPYLYPGDWDPSNYCMDPPTNVNTGHVGRCSGQYVWTDATSDSRGDGDDPDSNYDLTRLRITGDASNVYFLLTFSDVTDAGRPYVGIAVDTTLDSNGMDWLGDDPDTKVSSSALWEREIVANLNKTGYYDTSWAWTSAGSSLISADENTFEISMPWAALGVTLPTKVRFTVMVAQNDGGGTKKISASDALDAVTWNGPYMWPNEVSDTDHTIDYYFNVWFNAAGEVYSPLLVTGVLSNGPGSPECEWVRLTDTAGLTLPLLNWKIGDEETKGSTEGMKLFGDVTISSGSILLANNLGTCACGWTPDFTFTSMNNYSTWATGSVELANSGDEVLLLDDRDTVMDAVTWGTGSYPGVNPHTALAESHYLDRSPANVDTNNCATDFLDATGPCPPEPTLVELASFTARAEPALVRVSWETLSEIDSAGFNLWRSEAADGEYAQLNAGLIPARGGPAQPASYTYDDAAVTDGVTYYYRLEAVDLQGQSQLFGPVHATAGMWRRVYLPQLVQ